AGRHRISSGSRQSRAEPGTDQYFHSSCTLAPEAQFAAHGAASPVGWRRRARSAALFRCL
ncbi:MAG: hypothetical protein AVDCRST_MAG09-1651, partial [uncultured Sphingomonas sp.]